MQLNYYMLNIPIRLLFYGPLAIGEDASERLNPQEFSHIWPFARACARWGLVKCILHSKTGWIWG